MRGLRRQHLHEPRVAVGHAFGEVLVVVLVVEGELAELERLRHYGRGQELGLSCAALRISRKSASARRGLARAITNLAIRRTSPSPGLAPSAYVCRRATSAGRLAGPWASSRRSRRRRRPRRRDCRPRHQEAQSPSRIEAGAGGVGVVCSIRRAVVFVEREARLFRSSSSLRF